MFRFKTFIPGLFLVASSVWGSNPFNEYLKSSETKSSTYFFQKPPFKYPFERSTRISQRDFDISAFSSAHPEKRLEVIESIYRNFSFEPRMSMYAFPFVVHRDWEYLPYPFVGHIPKEDMGKWIPEFREKPSKLKSVSFQRKLDAVTGTMAFAGNKLKLLKTPASYQEILRRLEGVKDHAFISSYLFNCDQGTKGLVDLIGKKTRSGARVFILFDSFGAKSDPKCPGILKGQGAHVLLYKAGLGNIFHEKMFVFDGNFAMVDGQNLIAAGTLSNGVNNLFNDVAMGAEGPIVSVIGKRFIELWSKQSVMPSDLVKKYEDLFKGALKYATLEAVSGALSKTSNEGLCRVVTKSPKNSPQILNLYLETVRNTQHQLFFNYIDPKFRKPEGKAVGETFLREVFGQMEKNPGLRVDMLTNGWKDPFKYELPEGVPARKNAITAAVLKILDLTTKDAHKEMFRMRTNIMEIGVGENLHWWSYAQYMHAKTMMADNIWTVVGSYNMNANSEKRSYESLIACIDTDLAASMQESIVNDILNSIPIPVQ